MAPTNFLSWLRRPSTEYSSLASRPQNRSGRYHMPSDGYYDDDDLKSQISAGNEALHAEPSPRKLSRLYATCAATLSTFAILLCVGLLTARARTQNHALPSATDQDSHGGVIEGHGNLCGNSTAQALALGCSFDQLMWAWYPPGCPHYANYDYLQAGDWNFYLDWEGTQVAGPSEWPRALDNEIVLWGERREHLAHCVFMMLSVGQALRDARPISTRLMDYGHLEHCSRLLMDAIKHDPHWNDMETKAPPVNYGVSCPKTAILV